MKVACNLMWNARRIINHGSDKIHVMKFVSNFFKRLGVGVFEVWVTQTCI